MQRLRLNGPDGVVVKALARIARDMGSSPTWIQFFSANQMARE